MSRIRRITAREVLDAQGLPTLEVDLAIQDPIHSDETVIGRAIVPTGASGELRDQDDRRYFGKGVLGAVETVKNLIAPALLDREFTLQSHLDDTLREIDGTQDRSRLGSNTMLATSMAFCRAQSHEKRIPCHRNIAGIFGNPDPTLPVPALSVFRGGRLAHNSLAVHEILILPAGFREFSLALRAGAEIHRQIRRLLGEKGLSTLQTDSGAFMPVFSDEKPHEQALTLITQAIEDCGYHPATQIVLALDCRAGDFSDGKGFFHIEGKKKSADELASLYVRWATAYPIVSIEDPFGPTDWESWTRFTAQIGTQCQLTGGELFASKSDLVEQGVKKNAANSVRVQPAECGTVTETLELIKLAHSSKLQVTLNLHNGETEDNFASELASGAGVSQLRAGAPSGAEHIGRYNQLLRIEAQAGARAKFLGPDLLRRFMG